MLHWKELYEKVNNEEINYCVVSLGNIINVKKRCCKSSDKRDKIPYFRFPHINVRKKGDKNCDCGQRNNELQIYFKEIENINEIEKGYC